MRRIILNHFTSQSLRHHTSFKPISIPLLSPLTSKFFSSSDDQTPPNPNPNPNPNPTELSTTISDVSNKEFKSMLSKHFKTNDESMYESILEGILKRKISGKHEETDDELTEELTLEPLDDVPDAEFESDLEEACDTDEEIDNLYNARQYVEDKMKHDKYFNMSHEQYEEMIKEGVEKGFLRDTKECEDILEDMMCWDKLLPDEIKKKVEEKFNELGDMCERGEIEPEAAYELFKDFEDQMVLEYQELIAAEPQPHMEDVIGVPSKKVHLDDPPGEGPILTWQSRCVFAPGGDAWHPKNRKVKLSVTVKELGLSKHGFRRLWEIVGKRYNPGKDELTITSERFEHREENRKDCLRTLLSLIGEAAKADKLVEDTRVSYVKERLKANPAFMERLRAKTTKMKGSQSAVPL